MQTSKKINMYCFPPAGSSASIYYSWNKYVSNQINIIPIEYPGHGKKIRESLINDPDQLAYIIANEIISLGEQPFILFGHSVGASLLMRVEFLLRNHKIYEKLILLVISSRPAPEYLKIMQRKNSLTDEELLLELKLYNNFPEEILNNKDMLDFFWPIIKNDFLLSDHTLNDHIALTQKPLMAIYGEEDPYIKTPCIMQSWQNYSERWLGAYPQQGNHFYFLDQAVLVNTLDLISSKLEQLLLDEILLND